MAGIRGELKIHGYTVNTLRQLGRGGFGTVYEGSDKYHNTIAVKQISKSDRKNTSKEAVKLHFLKKNISNEHIVQVYQVKTWEDSMWIMMEFCDLGDLNNFFEKYYWKLDTMKKANLMKQVSKGISFLHSKDIVHRDVKPANILLKLRNVHVVVKLADFGLSKFLDPLDETSSMSSDVGTLLFKAPEFWDKSPDDRVRYHRNVDVYAAGLTFTAMLHAKLSLSLVPKAEGPLLSSETRMPIGLAAFTRCQNKKAEIQVVATENTKDSPLVRDLKLIIQSMTCFSPQARISASEVESRLDDVHRKVLEEERKKAKEKEEMTAKEKEVSRGCG